jgi:hypothetical protein
MQPIYIAFFTAIGIIIAIGVGMQLSNEIEDFTLYYLFWLLYIITIATFINIFLVANYYISMKDKTGPQGKVGPSGDRGDSGETGLCDPTCRDSICENQILELISDELKKKNQGVAVRFNNTYIKSKVRQMCASPEFRQLAPYNGPQNLINYLKDIWKLWLDLLYDAGGMKYFEVIGGETEFEWVKENPFTELKKYDVFYWGMGKQYRPMVKEKCYKSSDGNTPDVGLDEIPSIIKTSATTYYEFLGNNDGIRSRQNVSFWRAKQFTYKGTVYYPMGDVAVGPVHTYFDIIRDTSFGGFLKSAVTFNWGQALVPASMRRNKKDIKYVGNIKFSYKMEGPKRETLLVSGDVKGPIDYELLWTTKGSAGKNNFWVWRPIAPKDYICLGDVVTFTADKPNTNEGAPIRCVPKLFAIRQPTNGNRLWSSFGLRSPTNLTLLGFVPNTSKDNFVSASASNCYNLFRGMVGMSTVIPESDVNANFYYLDTTKYNSEIKIGLDTQIPDTEIEDNKVGSGYITPKSKDSKYSVLSYLNLKNNPTLKHNLTNIQIEAKMVPNAISNAYLIMVNNKCLNYNEKDVTLAECDELVDGQIFSVIFTGNKKNECRLQHYKSGKMIKYKNGLFSLVDAKEPSEMEYQMFTML